MKHTPEPWEIGEYDEHLGYDCMTGGIRVGPVILDAADYGQERCKDITMQSLAHLMADARLIAAAPALLKELCGMTEAIKEACRYAALDGRAYDFNPWIERAEVAIAKATKD